MISTSANCSWLRRNSHSYKKNASLYLLQTDRLIYGCSPSYATYRDHVMSSIGAFQMKNTWWNRRCPLRICLSAMDSVLFVLWKLHLYRHQIFVRTQWTSVSINTSIPVPRSSIPMAPIHQYSSIPILPILQYHQCQCRQYFNTINTNAANTSIPTIPVLPIHQYSSKPSIPIPESLGIATCLPGANLISSLPLRITASNSISKSPTSFHRRSQSDHLCLLLVVSIGIPPKSATIGAKCFKWSTSLLSKTETANQLFQDRMVMGAHSTISSSDWSHHRHKPNRTNVYFQIPRIFYWWDTFVRNALWCDAGKNPEKLFSSKIHCTLENFIFQNTNHCLQCVHLALSSDDLCSMAMVVN